ncbi:MAG: hypothetical protein V1658_00405, partial [Candidatus Micrarchaeota archaeon]
MDMKIIVGVVVLLVIGIIVYFGGFLNSEPVTSLPECDSLIPGTLGLNIEKCYLEKAVERQDLSICNKLSYHQDSKDECYQNVAAIKEDLSICEKISEYRAKFYCYQKVAVAT